MSDEDFEPTVGARGVSFENRIAIAALITAVVVLLTASVLFVFEQWQSEARIQRRNETALTQMLAVQLAPFEFRGDIPGVQWTLKALEQAPNVQAAYVYDAHGREIARFDAADRRPLAAKSLVRTQAALTYMGKPTGVVVVSSKPIALGSILPRYLAVCAGLFFAATGLALFMGRWLAGRVGD